MTLFFTTYSNFMALHADRTDALHGTHLSEAPKQQSQYCDTSITHLI